MQYPAETGASIGRIRDVLDSVALLRGVPGMMLDRLALMCQHHRFSDDDVVFRQGDPGDRMYIVARGRVLLFRADRLGEVRQLAAVDPGGYFGELALLSDNPRAATAQCEGATELLSISGLELKRLLAESAPAIRGIVGGTRDYVSPEQPPTFWERLTHRIRRGRGRGSTGGSQGV